MVALSSDHGVTDLPEWSLAKGVNACPVDRQRTVSDATAGRFFGRVYWRHTFRSICRRRWYEWRTVRCTSTETYLLDHDLDADSVLASIPQILEDTPGVKKVWSRQDIEQGSDDVARLLRHSVVPELSGDLFLQLYPDCMIGDFRYESWIRIRAGSVSSPGVLRCRCRSRS